MSSQSRIEYINLFNQKYNNFIASAEVYSIHSESPYSYASGNRLNPFTDVLSFDVKKSKFDSSSYQNKSQLALSCYRNYLYIEFDGYYDSNIGRYNLKAGRARMVVSTGDIRADGIGITSSFFLQYDSSYSNSTRYFNPVLLNNFSIVYYSENGRGAFRNIDYFPDHALKYYIDTNIYPQDNNDGTFEYYGKAQMNGAQFSNNYGVHTFTYAGDNKNTYGSYLIQPNLYDGVSLPIDSPYWNPDTNFEWIIQEFCKDYDFWKMNDNEQFPGAYYAGVTTSADHLYEWLNDKHRVLNEELVELTTAAYGSANPSTDSEIIDFFGLGESFDKSFSEYPGVFTDVRLGFGYVETPVVNGSIVSACTDNFNHIMKIEESLATAKEKADDDSSIKSLTIEQLKSLCSLYRTYSISYTDYDSTADENGNYATSSIVVSEYRLRKDLFYAANLDLRLMSVFFLFGIILNYDIPCDYDAIIVMIVAIVLTVLATPAAGVWTEAAAGEVVAIITVTAWIISILLLFGVGGKQEQKIMRALIIIFAVYLGAQYFFEQSTKDYAVAYQATKSGMYTSTLSDGTFTLLPTAKAMAIGSATILSASLGAVNMYNQEQAEDEYEDQEKKEALQSEIDEKLEKEKANESKINIANKHNDIFDFNKVFNQYDSTFDKKEKKGDIYGSYHKIYD